MIVAAASGSVGETIAPRTKATPHRGQDAGTVEAVTGADAAKYGDSPYVGRC